MACLAVGLVVEAGDHDSANLEAARAEVVDELEGVGIVGDAEVGPDFAPVDVAGVDAEDNLRVARELLEQPHFDVGIETGQHP